MGRGSGRSGANKKPIKLRSDAQVCYAQAGNAPKNRAVAARLFEELHPGAVDRPDKFVGKWGDRFNEKGTVQDAPRSGRPPKVTPDDAQRAAELFKAGRQPEQRGKPGSPLDKWRSVKQACDECAELQEIRVRSGECKHRTLLAAMKRVDRHLGVRTVRFKPKISAINRSKRLAQSKWNLRKWREDRGFFRYCFVPPLACCPRLLPPGWCC